MAKIVDFVPFETMFFQLSSPNEPKFTNFAILLLSAL